jgi:hypothetical protein
VSLLVEVLRETATGATPARAADRLGVDVGLVEAALDHAERIGLVLRAGCSSCTGAPAGPACAGCPLVSSRR